MERFGTFAEMFLNQCACVCEAYVNINKLGTNILDI